MDKRVLVTGADGLLGNNVVRLLLEQGYKVSALVQEGRQFPSLDELPIEQHIGDLLNIESLDKAVTGNDYVIHVAGLTDVWPAKGEKYFAVNVKGTQNLIEQVLKHKIKRMVCIGSASSFGFGTETQPGTESTPWKGEKYGLDYINSKLAGQNEIIKAVKEKALPALVINPTFMIGPYDTKPSSGAVLVAAWQNPPPFCTKGGRNWVAVKDVATATVNALHQGRIGECYIAGGQNMSYVQAFGLLEELTQKPQPQKTLPNFMILLTGWFASLFGKITGKAPKITYEMAKVACDSHFFSPAKAIAELNMPQTPIKEAMQEAFDWFFANGYLKK
ncbi:MAG: NAD-dependent epimerase/dehydratase family protein [Bacteroidota bacterium]